MNTENRYIIYTAEDIKRYLSGGMNNTEMYAIEKAALDDPFLTEAIEGYGAMEQKDWSKELADLKQKLEVVENTPIVPIHKTSFTKWWKAAAAVLLIGSSVAIAYFSGNKKSASDQLAVEEKVAPANSVAIAQAPPAMIDSAAKQTPVVIAGNNSANSGTITMQADSLRQSFSTDVAIEDKASDDFVYKPAPAPVYDRRNDGEAAKSQYEEETVTNKDVAAAGNVSNNNVTIPGKSNNGAYKDLNGTTSNNARLNYYNAQVVTPDNKPLPYANISIPQYTKPVYTDAKGNAVFAAADSAVNVTVTSAGYLPQNFKLQNNSVNNKLVLQPADVATREFGQGRKKTAAKAELKKEAVNAEMEEADEDAEPAGGWVEYNSYLSNNLVAPGNLQQKNIHGEVEVTVQLKSNGEIATVKVGKPLCPECDAEALRLVKEGPKWETKKNKATKVKVKVKF